MNFPIEFFDFIKNAGHALWRNLQLKIGAPIILIRNWNQQEPEIARDKPLKN